MTKEEFDEILEQTNAVICNREWYERAIKALETLEEFEKAQIITGGRLNGRTYAYKCGLEDGKRKALEQNPDLKEAYRKGYKDGQEALAFHLELCKEEQEPTVKENLVVGDCISKEFIEIVVKYPPADLCTYPEYKRKPYFSIKYRENGKEYVGFGTYKIEMLSQWIKEYFMPSIQPKLKTDEPMQVELEGDGYADGKLVYDYGKCPKCGWEFEYGDKDWEQPYCCHCGQRLHWFESENEE